MIIIYSEHIGISVIRIIKRNAIIYFTYNHYDKKPELETRR